MKKMITAIATVAALSLPVLASAATYNIDPDHSNIGLE